MLRKYRHGGLEVDHVLSVRSRPINWLTIVRVAPMAESPPWMKSVPSIEE